MRARIHHALLALPIALAASGCVNLYTVVQAPTESLAKYGQWDVPKPEVAEKVYGYYPHKPNEWRAKVENYAAGLQAQTLENLRSLRAEGAAVHVRLRIENLRTSGSGLFLRLTWDASVLATFVDASDNRTVASCWVSRDIRSIPDAIAEFVADHSK